MVSSENFGCEPTEKYSHYRYYQAKTIYCIGSLKIYNSTQYMVLAALDINFDFDIIIYIGG